MYLLPHGVLKSLCVWPGFAIDRRQRLPRTCAGNLRYHLYHKNFVLRARTGRIYDDCTSQLRVDTMAPFQIINFGGGPIQVQTGRCRCESHLLHSSWSDMHNRIAVADLLSQPMYSDCDRERVVEGCTNLRS